MDTLRSIKIKESTYKIIKRMAKKEERTLSGELEHIVRNYLQRSKKQNER